MILILIFVLPNARHTRHNPTQNTPRQTRRQTQAEMPVRQSPDLRPPPCLPKFLQRFPWRQQIMNALDQQNILRPDGRPAGSKRPRSLIQLLPFATLLLQLFPRLGPKHQFRERQIAPHPRFHENRRAHSRIVANGQSRQPPAQRTAPKRHARAALTQKPPCQSPNFGNRLRGGFAQAQIVQRPQRSSHTRPPFEMIGALQSRHVEPRPNALPSEDRKSHLVPEKVLRTMQQNNRRPFPPLLHGNADTPVPVTAIQPSINNIILFKLARPRRRKPKIHAFSAAQKLNPRRLTLPRNKLRPIK